MKANQTALLFSESTGDRPGYRYTHADTHGETALAFDGGQVSNNGTERMEQGGVKSLCKETTLNELHSREPSGSKWYIRNLQSMGHDCLLGELCVVL